MHQIRTSLLLAVLLAAGLLSMGGCDPTVDVLQPSDRYRYSLFGALNVAADTQVIRVDQIGTPTEVGASANFDATVVLRNRSSGEEIPLRDSLTTVVFDSTQMHNFWTTHPIEPGTAYQVVVRNDGRDVTTATTTTPVQAPDLSVETPIDLSCTVWSFTSEKGTPFRVFVRDIDRVAAVITHYPVLFPQGEKDTLRTWVSRHHYYEVTEERNRMRLSVFYAPELRGISPESGLPDGDCPPMMYFFRSSARLVVAAGGPQWPAWRGASLDEIARLDTFSNVQGGHGFVGGVYTDTIQVPLK